MVVRMAFWLAVAGVTMAGSAHAADETFGRWAATDAACSAWSGSTAKDSPLVVTQYSVRWYDGPCSVGRMYKTGKAVHIEAHCWQRTDGQTTPVTLEASGNRMRANWNRGPVNELRRCP